MLHAFRVAALPMSCVIRFKIGRSGADRDTQLICLLLKSIVQTLDMQGLIKLMNFFVLGYKK
jgi:hypothetical protein